MCRQFCRALAHRRHCTKHAQALLCLAGNVVFGGAPTILGAQPGQAFGQITGIEVKASATVESKDFKGLRHLQETEAEIFQRGIVLYTGREIVPFGKDLWAIPLSVWWARRDGGATSNRSSD